MKSFGIMVTATLFLSGCGLFGDTFRDRSDDYQLAEEIEPITVPGEMDSDRVGEIYPIPAITDDSLIPGEFEAPRPLRASDVGFEKQVKIQTLAGRSWILVQTDPGETWPRVRNVLNRNGIPAANMDAPNGILDTVWVDFKDDPDHSYRFRFNIASGVQLNSTEISIIENHVVKGQQDNAVWTGSSMNPQREEEMLTLMAETLAGDLDSGSVSLLAQSIGGEPKVEVVNPKQGTPYMIIKLGMERSWASVGYSAERGGFSTVDKNRSTGTYFVNFEETEAEEPGFFSRLLGGGEDSQDVNDTGDYQIAVIANDRGVQVSILAADGEKLERYHALYLLKILRTNLS